MKVAFSGRFTKNLADSPEQVQKAFGKQFANLMRSIRHPSLHAKKYNETEGIWQARVDRVWRFYFSIEGNTYYFHDITSHPK